MASRTPNTTPNKIARCILTDFSAALSVLLISLLVTYIWHIPAAILLIQILAVELFLQTLPISTLQHDKVKKKPRHHMHVKVELVAFGIWAGLISYGSYLLFFGYHVISPVYIDTNNSLYVQATTLALVTFALCQAVNILFVRADEHLHMGTKFLWENKKLLRAFAMSGFLLLNLVYNPLLHSLLGTAPLSLLEWIVALFCTTIYIGGRRLQRHSRQFSRHAVRELHLKHDIKP